MSSNCTCSTCTLNVRGINRDLSSNKLQLQSKSLRQRMRLATRRTKGRSNAMKPLKCLLNRHSDALVQVTAKLLMQATKNVIYVNLGFKVTTKCLRCQRTKTVYKFQLTLEEEAMLQLHNLEAQEMTVPRQ